MKPGDILKIKLAGDIQNAELVKVNAKTVLVKVLWHKSKAKDGTKIIKIPKIKIIGMKEAAPTSKAPHLEPPPNEPSEQSSRKLEEAKEVETMEATQSHYMVDQDSVSGSGTDVTETSTSKPLSKLAQMKARIAAKKGDE